MLLKIISMILLMIFSGGQTIMRYDRLTDSFKEATSIVVTIEGEQSTLQKGDDKYETILNALNKITKYSHEMPAFGVSLDDMTREELKKGTWIELNFDGECSYEGMSFEGLLVKVDKSYFGFNLIRRNNGKYDGRCFYLSLDNSMAELANAIDSLSLTQNKSSH